MTEFKAQPTRKTRPLFSSGAMILSAVSGAVAAVALMTVAPAAPRIDVETFRQLDLFGEVFERIHSDYVADVEDEELIEGAINGMLSTLDPHSSYLPPERFEDVQVQTSGEYGGLGLEVTLENGVVRVVSPIDDTPAQRAGIIAGDFITELDGERIMGKTLTEAIEIMKGKPGTKITLTVAREGLDDTFDVDITRAVIVIKSVRHRIEEDDIGYVRIATFSEQTEKGLLEALDHFKKELGSDMTGIVLDLRDNPGGLIDQAVAVSSAFLDGGQVVSTRGRNPRDNEVYNARARDLTSGAKVVVLINRGTASASEIVAGAIQDRERGVVIGTRSFGKGSVQTILPLQGGVNGALRITTARYYTPGGRSIQAQGIDPDLLVLDPNRPEDDRITEADLPNALDADRADEVDLADEAANDDEEAVTADSSDEAAESEDEEQVDVQLERAIAILRGEVEIREVASR